MTVADRFWSKVQCLPGPCWLWTGTRQHNGYGRILVDGRMRQAHRVSYELTFGPVPAGLQVCHKCDNPPCVNPDHLFVGTQSDNLFDQGRKGRNALQVDPSRSVLAQRRREMTHCKRGHSLAEHARIKNDGKRECALCKLFRGERRRALARSGA